MALCYFRLFLPDLAIKKSAKLPGRHPVCIMVCEVAHVKPKASVSLDINDFSELSIVGIIFPVHRSIGRKAHDLVFRIIDADPKIGCDG